MVSELYGLSFYAAVSAFTAQESAQGVKNFADAARL